VRFTTGTVEIQFLPLDETGHPPPRTDTYRSLTQLIISRRTTYPAATRAGMDQPTLVLVTFYGLVPQARFTRRT